MQREANLFKAMSDPIRLRLAILLAISGETCVCYLAEALGEPEFKISHHLAVLRGAGMVEARREGTWMHYRLVEPRSALEVGLHSCLRENFLTHQTVREDLARLQTATCRRAEQPPNRTNLRVTQGSTDTQN